MNVICIYQMGMPVMSHSFHKYIFVMCSSLSLPINCKHWSTLVLILQCFSICILEKDNFLKLRLNLGNWGKKLSLWETDYICLLETEERIEDRSFSRTFEDISMNESTKDWGFLPLSDTHILILINLLI